MKRELDNMETIHTLYVAYHKQLFISDILLSMWIVLAIGLCSICAVINLQSNRIWVVVLEVILICTNIYSAVVTVRRMARVHRDLREENRLYEQARAEMLKFCEIEELIGEELELDFGEEENE